MAETDVSQPGVKTIHLHGATLGRILDCLDEAAQGASPRGDTRRAQRYRYRMTGVVVHMQHPGSGRSIPYLVPTRNISEVGLSFLHGGFVHTGTRCLAQLITSHGSWGKVVGTVVRCRHVASGVHEVGVEFDRGVEMAEYCPEATHLRILLAEDDPAESRLTIFHLEQLSAEVDHAENGRVAVARALEKPYDVIIMDVEMPVLDGLAAVAELRSKGYTGMIVAATALTHDDDRMKCLQAGCDRHLPKPLARSDLENLLQSLRE